MIFNNLKSRIVATLLAAAWTASSQAQSGGGWDGSWRATSGGGTSARGDWSVSGTAAQAVTTRSSEGSWSVQGGFWNRVTGNLSPTAGTASFSRARNHSLKIPIATLLTNTFESDGESPAFASADATSTNGATVSADLNYVYYSPGTNGNNTDRFTYRIKDGYQGAAAGTVVITIVDSTGQSFNITGLSTLPDGNKRLYFAGIPGRNYLIQAATNLTPPIDWATLATNAAGSDGLWNYVDLQATNFASRYYRAAAP